MADQSETGSEFESDHLESDVFNNPSKSTTSEEPSDITGSDRDPDETEDEGVRDSTKTNKLQHSERANEESTTKKQTKKSSEATSDAIMYGDGQIGFRNMIQILREPDLVLVSNKAVRMVKPFEESGEVRNSLSNLNLPHSHALEDIRSQSANFITFSQRPCLSNLLESK